MAKRTSQKLFLAIDGGATKSRSALISEEGKVIAKFQSSACNAVLLSEIEMTKVFKAHLKALGLKPTTQVELASICLAGVVNDKSKLKVKRAFRGLVKSKHLAISSDLASSLLAGHGKAEGIVTISGTGSCVFAMSKHQKAKAGGWGHVMGDVGSAYHIAHQGLRRAVADYDLYGKFDVLGKAVLQHAKVKTAEELSVFVSHSSKAELARLSRAVFDAHRRGHQPSTLILIACAQALAANVLAVRRKMKGKSLPVSVAGGVFEAQPEYFQIFSEKLKIHWPDVVITYPKFEAAIGAHLWGCFDAGIDVQGMLSKLPRVKSLQASGKTTTKKKKVSLSHLESVMPIRPADEATLPTEKPNPYTKNLSEVDIQEGVDLMIEQDARLTKVLEEARVEISHAIHLIADAFQEGGRLFYIGAGTSGRLGVLDASECPPTFSVSESMVQGIIAGGSYALRHPVEGAEDDRKDAPRELSRRALNEHDVVVGIAASGRTPFVLSGLEYAHKKKARTVLLTCNPGLRSRKNPNVECEIHLNSGPESLTGSTRLRSGTLCKMVLNMFTTLAMTKIGKVKGNYMINVAATNEKLQVRAIGLVMTLAEVGKEEAFSRLVKSDWNVRQAIEL